MRALAYGVVPLALLGTPAQLQSAVGPQHVLLSVSP